MGLTPQQSLIIKYDYYEVFDKNKIIRYGITSDEDKEKIEEKYPGKYIFEKFDLYDNYIWLDKLEERSGISCRFKNLNNFETILIIILTVNIIVDLICILFCI